MPPIKEYIFTHSNYPWLTITIKAYTKNDALNKLKFTVNNKVLNNFKCNRED